MSYFLLPLNGNDHRGVVQLHIQDVNMYINMSLTCILICPIFSKPEHTTLLGVKIMDHTPILKFAFLLLFAQYYGFPCY